MKLWGWIKAGLIGLGVLILAILGVKVTKALWSRPGRVEGLGVLWKPDPKKPDSILVAVPGSTTLESVPLPKGVSVERIRAVAPGTHGEVVVDVKHTPKDRRGGKP